MEFKDSGIVISIKKYGESAGLLEVITENHGRHMGLVRGYQSKNNKALLQPGNTLDLIWRARLSEHLGVFNFELAISRSHMLMINKIAIIVLQNMILHLKLLPEREIFNNIFYLTQNTLDLLSDDDKIIENFIKWELFFLKELGYGVDLSECAVTKTKNNLKYVSPKSRRAVSKIIGDPYKDKLLEIPAFLLGDNKSDKNDLVKGLLLTEFFLKQDLYDPMELKLTSFRDSLYKLLNNN
jgi:DNA repair protein RecO (recombination protein O)